ncbi:MAG: hypothetical protein ACYCTG_09630 [Ferrimicrobium sp.]
MRRDTAAGISSGRTTRRSAAVDAGRNGSPKLLSTRAVTTTYQTLRTPKAAAMAMLPSATARTTSAKIITRRRSK